MMVAGKQCLSFNGLEAVHGHERLERQRGRAGDCQGLFSRACFVCLGSGRGSLGTGKTLCRGTALGLLHVHHSRMRVEGGQLHLSQPGLALPLVLRVLVLRVLVLRVRRPLRLAVRCCRVTVCARSGAALGGAGDAVRVGCCRLMVVKGVRDGLLLAGVADSAPCVALAPQPASRHTRMSSQHVTACHRSM